MIKTLIIIKTKHLNMLEVIFFFSPWENGEVLFYMCMFLYN